ncbi:toll/interleukin-1 receptor domain-containing protein [Aquincola sp. S2]|uniref:Toll/interleukin-1 receptor domain-containing protein n=1 Tax=Pseudaquabacterium terrae TaxID=2732868 RepID=A0ABX2ERE7_9BURK|nr:toll/interleukin-1 receptor domain-containing protein [Aquabacterium terrae]
MTASLPARRPTRAAVKSGRRRLGRRGARFAASADRSADSCSPVATTPARRGWCQTCHALLGWSRSTATPARSSTWYDSARSSRTTGPAPFPTRSTAACSARCCAGCAPNTARLRRPPTRTCCSATSTPASPATPPIHERRCCRAHDVFLSYRSSDREAVAEIADGLRAEGFGVWWDQQIPGSAEWRHTIEQHLGAARCVVVVWSAAAVDPVEGRWVQQEADEAERLDRCVPAHIDDVLPPLGLRSRQSIDLIDWHGDRADPRWRQLVEAIRAVHEQRAPQPVPPSPPVSPLRGRGTLLALLAGVAALVATIAARFGLAPAAGVALALVLGYVALDVLRARRRGERAASNLLRRLLRGSAVAGSAAALVWTAVLLVAASPRIESALYAEFLLTVQDEALRPLPQAVVTVGAGDDVRTLTPGADGRLRIRCWRLGSRGLVLTCRSTRSATRSRSAPASARPTMPRRPPNATQASSVGNVSTSIRCLAACSGPARRSSCLGASSSRCRSRDRSRRRRCRVTTRRSCRSCCRAAVRRIRPDRRRPSRAPLLDCGLAAAPRAARARGRAKTQPRRRPLVRRRHRRRVCLGDGQRRAGADPRRQRPSARAARQPAVGVVPVRLRPPRRPAGLAQPRDDDPGPDRRRR